MSLLSVQPTASGTAMFSKMGTRDFEFREALDVIIMFNGKDISQLNLHVDDKGVNLLFFSTLSGT